MTPTTSPEHSRPGRLRSTATLLAWTVGLAGAIWVLTRLGRDELAAPPLRSRTELEGWADRRDVAEIVMAIVRLLGLALAWYLVALTVVGALARLSRASRLTRVTDSATPTWVRTLLDHTVGIGLTGTAVLGAFAAGMADDGAATAPVELAAQESGASADTATMNRLDGTATMRRLPADPSPPPDLVASAPTPSVADVLDEDAATPGEPAPDVWIIEDGDHLWSIAEETLRDQWGRSPTDAEIDPYWRELIEANRQVLAVEDNPDIVFAGQVFRLPPAPDPP